MRFSQSKHDAVGHSSNIKIRLFALADLSHIQNIRQRAFAPIFKGFRDQVGEDIYNIEYIDADQQQADYLQTICIEDNGMDIYVATQGETVIGFIAFVIDIERHTGTIDLNAVDPTHQGKGAGRLLYDHAVTCMKQRGVRLIKVSTGGDPAHSAARKAYKKAGFLKSIPGVVLYKML